MFDILIKNGTIIDGSGAKSFKADIGIEGDTISAIGNLSDSKAAKIIDATDKIVCPGFVDILNRSDTFGTLFEIPSQESLLRQGITTIIGGNCGASLAPIISPDAINAIQKWADIKKIAANWSSVAEFFFSIANKKFGVNFGTLIGHTSLRRGLLKGDTRPLEKGEIEQMEYIADMSMKSGALGISAGLVFAHSNIAPTEELISLAKIVKKHNCYFSLHLRNDGESIIAAINEAIRISQEGNIPLEISHFKIIGKKHWPLLDTILGMIDSANKNGAQITFDVFPYAFSANVLYTILPQEIAKENKEKLASILKDKEIKKEIVKEMQKNPALDYGKIIIAMSGGDKSFIGHTIETVAKNQGLSQEEVILNSIIESRGRIIGFMPDIDEENIRKQIKSELSLISSNSAGYDLSFAKSRELAHPRCFGAFPRAIKKYAIDEGLIPMETMIAKMTSKPASKIGLAKRGEIKIKNFADIIIFNPQKIKDNATLEMPYQYPDGIDWVLVNGQPAIENGNYNGALNGKVLKKY